MRLALSEYRKRLIEAISEVDLVDKRGNVIIAKDLKVTHKKSGYEYTVDDVVNVDGEMQIVLRSPESPRFEDPGQETLLGGPQNPAPGLSEDDLALPSTPPGNEETIAITDISPEGEEEEVLFVIDREDFEKEYEIK